jgi:uncharacterized LabA/DUF88 family protein
MMVFVDGENMVFRYQSMLQKGWVPRDDGITHLEDVLVWHKTFSHLAREDQVLRATYYTYVVGDTNKIRDTRQAIKSLEHKTHRNSTLPNRLTPKVFKKPRSAAEAKGVDIQLTVDVLTHVHSDNVDTVLLLSGDGDYLPLIQEVQRCGKLCYVSAFSDGLNEELTYAADKFYCLDGGIFHEREPECT